MIHERKNEIFKEVFDSCLNLQYGKAKDYATNVDALSNFKSQDAEVLGLTPFQKWGVYFGKQAMSILGAIGKNPEMPSTTSEPIEERINDAIIYLVLLKCLLEDSSSHPQVQEKPKEYKKPHTKVNITKNEDSSFNLTFSESISVKLNGYLYVYNETEPYIQYQFLTSQVISKNTYKVILIQSKKWTSSSSSDLEWSYEKCDDIDLKSGHSWFVVQQ
jgi:hypothetical protein